MSDTNQTPILPWSFNPEAIEVWVDSTRYMVDTVKQSAERYGIKAGWRRVPEKWMRSTSGLNLILRAEDRLRLMQEDNDAALAKITGESK